MTSTLLAALMQVIITVCVPALTAILGYHAKHYVNAFIEKKTNAETTELLKRGVDIIGDSVNFVQQTMVDDYKNNGTFTKEVQVETFAIAKDMALAQMSDAVSDAIKEKLS